MDSSPLSDQRQKIFGITAACLLATAAIMKGMNAPHANNLLSGIAFINNFTNLNRYIRRVMPLSFGVRTTESALLIWNTAAGQDWPLNLRSLVTALDALLGQPAHQKELLDEERRTYFLQRDTEQIKYLAEITAITSVHSLKEAADKLAEVLSAPPKNEKEQEAQWYAFSLVALTTSVSLQLSIHHPAFAYTTFFAITVANGLAMRRYWQQEENLTACIANTVSIIGYPFADTDAGVALLTFAGALFSLSRCGIKGTALQQNISAFMQQLGGRD
jgi:hypothetical protein